MKRLIGILFILVSSLLFLTISSSVAAQQIPHIPEGYRVFGASLTGAAEVPGPGDPDGRGLAGVATHEERGEVCFGIFVRNITLPASMAHIHVGGADVAGDIVVHLVAPNARGISTGCVSADVALIQAIQNNPAGYYVNVHTSDYPAGAVRGQLFPVDLNNLPPLPMH